MGTLAFGLIFFLCFIGTQVIASTPYIMEKGGKYYTDPSWYDDPVEEYEWILENRLKGAEIFSNNPRALQLHLSHLVIPLPKTGDSIYAKKILQSMHPGFLIVSLNGKKRDSQYMDADALFSCNDGFENPARFSQVFTNPDAKIYQVISPAK
jgi:hypothetical protein